MLTMLITQASASLSGSPTIAATTSTLVSLATITTEISAATTPTLATGGPSITATAGADNSLTS